MNSRIVLRFKPSALRSFRIIVILMKPLTTVGNMVGKRVENAVELQCVKNFGHSEMFFFLMNWGGSNKISIKMQ